MNVEVKFDCNSKMMFIPDGYITEPKGLQAAFLDWVQQQPECIAGTKGICEGYGYNEEDFLRYVNTVVLKDSKEKAYFISALHKNSRKRCVIEF